MSTCYRRLDWFLSSKSDAFVTDVLVVLSNSFGFGLTTKGVHTPFGYGPAGISLLYLNLLVSNSLRGRFVQLLQTLHCDRTMLLRSRLLMHQLPFSFSLSAHP